MKNKALYAKRLIFYGEKRLREIYHPFGNKELKSKNYLASLIRNSFIQREQYKLVRPFWSFKRWKKQFIFFHSLTLSSLMRDQTIHLTRGTIIEVFFLRTLFLKRVLLDRKVSIKRYDGIVSRVKGREKATSSLIFRQAFPYGERVVHRIFSHAPNLLGVGRL
jgi:hypothetical protein